MAHPLSAEQLRSVLDELADWSGNAQALRRTVECSSFAAAVRLVDAVAAAADAMDHHPDIDIRWRTVSFTLSTHTVKAVSELDAALARRINRLVDELD